jgi:hypothetical protein
MSSCELLCERSWTSVSPLFPKKKTIFWITGHVPAWQGRQYPLKQVRCFLLNTLPILPVVWCWMYNYEIFPTLIAGFRDNVTYWNAAILPLDHIWTNRSNCSGQAVVSWGFPCHQMSQSRMWTNSSQRKYNKCSVQWYPSPDYRAGTTHSETAWVSDCVAASGMH